MDQEIIAAIFLLGLISIPVGVMLMTMFSENKKLKKIIIALICFLFLIPIAYVILFYLAWSSVGGE